MKRLDRIAQPAGALLLAASLALASGCAADEGGSAGGDTGSPGEPGGIGTGDTAATAGADAGVTSQPDVDDDTGAPPDPDAATTGGHPHVGDQDAGATGDVAPADAGPPPEQVGPLARVYENNPLDGELLEVEMPNLKTHSGWLTGDFVRVFNCTQKPGGKSFNYQGYQVTMCNQGQTAEQGPDGSWLHIEPPSSDKDGNDAFAELMMYWHVNRIHDWFGDAYGLHNLDFTMDALVNVQFSVFGGWLPFDNAAFVPKESLGALGLPLDLSGDSIIFGQGTNVDFSYEADVIYHEYTHAMIGTTRLMGVTLDQYGPTNLPSGMNEGFADYFAASLANDPLMGAYALTNVSSIFAPGPPQDLSRDLSELKRCPEDLTTEFHADGEIVGSAMWAIRQALGAEVADGVILEALQTFTNETTIEDAGLAIAEAAAKLDPPRDAEVTAILEDHGMLGCDRVMDYAPFEATGPGALPVEVPGTMTTGLYQFKSWVPGFLQWRFALPEGKVAFKIEMDVIGGSAYTGYGGPAPTLSLLVKKGADAIEFTYKGATVTHDADAEIKLDKGKASQQGLTPFSATISGTCVDPGDYVLQLKNVSKTGGQIYSLKITALSDAPEGDPTYTACP